MPTVLSSLRARLDSSPNRIALSTAMRGMIAIAAPLLLLPPLGFAGASHLAVIGALQTSIVDSGGPYGGRLRGMLANSIGSPVLLLTGTWCGGHWWLAAPAMALAAVLGGLLRALGPGATSIGVTYGVALLIGIELALPTKGAAEAALVYGAGGLWTIVLALLVWRLRPYKRLEQELAVVWEELAGVLAPPQTDAAHPTGGHHRERRLHQRQRSFRDAVERARTSLGDARAEISGPGTVIGHLLVLLRAAARIGAASVALAERPKAGAQPSADHQPWSAATAALEQACRATAKALATGNGEVSVELYRSALTALDSSLPASATAGFALALRHLENASASVSSLFGARHRMPGLLPPLEPMPPLKSRLATLRAHLSLQSLILRHALRVALSAGLATGIMTWLAIPHGIWLPMTALVVPQPEFGGTLRRAGERVLGTIAGAILAALLLQFLHGTLAFDLAIIGLSFGVFALLRRRYGWAMTFLTPLIILQLGFTAANPWIEIRDRVVDTVGGGLLALITAYVLWPQWEQERLGKRLAEAIAANAAYLQGVLGLLACGAAPEDAIVQARRAAEIATGNAEAAFERMLGEPKARRGPVGQRFAAVIHLRRLNRHTTALLAELEHAPCGSPQAAVLAGALRQGLDEAAAHLGDQPPAGPFDPPEATILAVRREVAAAGRAEMLAQLIGRIASDVSALHYATSLRQTA